MEKTIFSIIYSVLFLITCSLFGQESLKKPNVILILADDQGYGDMSCNGNPYLKTPAIDALQKTSVSLSDFHVDPTCAPTRAALMTGRYSARVGVWLTIKGRHHLRKGEVTVADVFSDNQYETAIFGKWHLGDNYPFRPQDRGFKESLIHGGGVVGEIPDFWGNNYYDDTYFRNGEPEKVKGYATDVWFDETKKFITNSDKKDKPFFVYLSLNAPHGPLHVPEKYVKPYLNMNGVPKGRALFYGMIASIDENLEKLRTFLEDRDLDKNTIIIYMTDNGTASGVTQKVTQNGNQFKVVDIDGFNAGLRGKKGTPYEGGHRAACIIHWPQGNLNKATEVSRLTANIDVLPTLIDLAGLNLKNQIDFDGKSFKTLLYNPKDENWSDRTIVVNDQTEFKKEIESDLPVKYKEFSVMNEKWRLVGDELYAIENDPRQTIDVSSKYPQMVNQLKRVYENWWDDVSEKFHTYNSTIIGSTHQKEIRLDAQFWHGAKKVYSQQHVRSAVQANGFWDIEVESSGKYKIELRRWPRELNKAINEIVELPILNAATHDLGYRLYKTKSEKIEAVSARLKVGGFDELVTVSPNDKKITFEVSLEKGKVDLQAWFINAEGIEWGAYYVYINKI